MNSKERVKKAIYFQGPDKVPHYLPDGEPNDLFWAAPWHVGGNPGLADKQDWVTHGSIQRKVDAWGIEWERSITDSGKGQAKRHPIVDLSRQADYQFPPANHSGYFQAVRAKVQENEQRANPLYILGVAPFSSLNEGTHNIRGLQNMFMDYYANPDDLKALIGRLADGQLESIEQLAVCGCDGVMFYDDWGLQTSLMVGPDLIEEFFMPFYRRNWGRARELGLDTWMHSCGYIIDLLNDFSAAGLNVIQMDQQQNMGLENLAATAGGKIAFWCPADIQGVMVEGNADEVKQYVRQMIATLGNFNGGLVSMAYTTPEDIGHDPAKTAAMCAAFREYGVYGV